MAEEQAAEQTPKKGRGKTLVVMGVVLAVEAAVIFGGVMMFGSPPQPSGADDALNVAGVPETERISEILIIDTRLPNRKTGITYVYDTEVYAQVKNKYGERVQTELDQYQNEIRSEIAAIWRTAEPHHFQEPRLENLTRKVYALLNERFGADQDNGESIISKAVIVMGTGFRVDG